MSNANLLEVVSFDDTVKSTQRGSVPPQMMEFQVNAELAPFLVSSTRAVLWVEKTSTAGNVRAAVRDRRGLETELVAAVVAMSEKNEWGNTQPLSTMGIKNCVDHLRSYGLEQVEILVAKDTDVTDIDFKNLRVVEANWVPVDAVIVVPADRGFVGTLGTVGQNKAVALIHNASRGLAVAYRSENHESVAGTSA